MDDACKRHGRVRCDECAEMGGLRARLAEANAEVKRLTTAWRAIDRANVSLRERLAAATAAARFYARYYDGPAESLLGEEDRKAFQWVELNRGEP